MLCTAAVARAEDGGRAPLVISAAAGGAVATHGEKLAALDLEVGGLVAPRVALGAALTVQGTVGGNLGLLGPQVQVLPSGAFTLSVGGGLAFVGSGRDLGSGIRARAGFTLLDTRFAPTISAELLVTRFEFHGDGTEVVYPTTGALMVGMQLRDAAATSDPAERRRAVGEQLIAGGSVVEITALLVGAGAREMRDDARGTGACSYDLSRCSSWVLPTAETAYRYSLVSTGLFIAGTAGIVAGVYLLSTAPAGHAVTVTPSVASGSAGAVVGGRF